MPFFWYDYPSYTRLHLTVGLDLLVREMSLVRLLLMRLRFRVLVGKYLPFPCMAGLYRLVFNRRKDWHQLHRL